MTRYVDAYVVPLPKRNLKAYRRMAMTFGKIWREHGALEYNECLADDVKPGKETSFPQAVKLRSDEIVVSSWAVYSSRADRDRANQAIMADEAFKELAKNITVDMKRMFSSGFKFLRGL